MWFIHLGRLVPLQPLSVGVTKRRLSVHRVPHYTIPSLHLVFGDLSVKCKSPERSIEIKSSSVFVCVCNAPQMSFEFEYAVIIFFVIIPLFHSFTHVQM